MKIIIGFSPTTFIAAPKASAELSLTVGSVKSNDYAVISTPDLTDFLQVTIITFKKSNEEY